MLREQALLSQGFCLYPDLKLKAMPILPWEPHPRATSGKGFQQGSVSSCHS